MRREKGRMQLVWYWSTDCTRSSLYSTIGRSKQQNALDFQTTFLLCFIFLQVAVLKSAAQILRTVTRYILCLQENYLLYPTKGLSILTQILKIPIIILNSGSKETSAHLNRQHTGRLRKRDSLLTEEGGLGANSNDGDKAPRLVLYKSSKSLRQHTVIHSLGYNTVAIPWETMLKMKISLP